MSAVTATFKGYINVERGPVFRVTHEHCYTFFDIPAGSKYEDFAVGETYTLEVDAGVITKATTAGNH